MKTELDGNPVAEVAHAPGSDWTTCYKDVQIPDGTTGLWFVYQGEGSIEFKSFELI